jgi:uncharacterized protein YodC (DUF2158 family)
MIKVGDLVIKNTGGNKMKVISISNDVAECVWFTETFNNEYFEIKNLLPIADYPKIFKSYYRQDKINKILN